jgi:hypothetical protein
MTFIRTLAATAAAGALVLAPVAPAFAQEADTAPEMERSVPDALLDSFITAALSVSEIAEEYQGRMQSADDDAARQELATEARTAMISAVEETDGITVEEYLEISEAARVDEDLGQRLQDRFAAQADVE